ncbi:mucosal pentraxin-like [Xenopus laevis]|uniref:Pentraxin family member n=1 Tax=Xenopus laevis TaxID=8355 RepID=A0A8J1LNT3_XENLA|nr:mucosal pentraxin-like [Xenopus laevis]
MEKTRVVILILLTASGILTQKDMDGKVFLMPRETSTSYVRLYPMRNGPIANLTVCLKCHTDLARTYTLFSLATSSKYNDFLMFHYTNRFSIYVGNQQLFFNIPSTVELRSICVSWGSLSGEVVLWINGNPYPRKMFMKGYRVGANPIIIIGQEQDNYGGGFDASQSFVGEISDVHMWDRVLSSQDLMDVLYNSNISGNVINWQNLTYETKGEVLVLPQLCKLNYKPDCCNIPS